MRRIIGPTVSIALAAALSACATPSNYTDTLAKAEASHRGAQEAGAEDVPFAKLHLKMSTDEMEAAKKLEADGKDDEACRMLESARADAELAIGRARQGNAEQLAQQAQAQVDAIQQQSVAPAP